MRFTVDRLDHLVLHCENVDVLASWYQRVLGMDREEFGEEKRTALKFGGQKINLRPVDANLSRWHSSDQVVSGSADLCFITAVGPEQIVDHLRKCGVVLAQGPVPKTGALGPMTSIYCRDPEGNLIEISTYLEV
jgi:catechol 2,3-dioxygenase-like lactoylglutathione lyase family enzyme